jgi:hypothetical protein
MKKIPIYLLFTAAFIQFACKKNSSNTPPTITSVRLVDPTKKDSTFTQAQPGTLIAIQGTGLLGTKAILFNDTVAYFNPVYVTNTTIIVSIPTYAQTAATNPSVPSTIILFTDHGKTTFTFKLVLPAPVISSIALDDSGTELTITGTNLTGVSKVTFPITGGNGTPAPSFKEDTGHNLLTAAIPPGNAYVDSIRVYCTFGVASFPYPPPMTIAAISNENATAGTTITVTGSNFIGVSKVIFPGNISATPTVNNVRQLTVTVPAGITSADSLRLSGALGTAASQQLFDSYFNHPSPGYLCNFDVQYSGDNTGFIGWTGAYADAPTAAAAYPKAISGVGVLLQGGTLGKNAGPTSQANPGNLQLNDVPWVANTGASINGYSLKFEIYVLNNWKAGEIWIAVGDWYAWSSYTARYAPWETAPGGVFHPSGWTTVTIPLTQFIQGNQFWQTSWTATGAPATKFSDYPFTSLCFMVTNDQGSAVSVADGIQVAIDNVRIVKGQ